MEAAAKAALAVLLNYAVHYVAMTAHNQMCMPHTLRELAQAMFLTASPACSALLTVGQHTQSAYASAITTGVVTLAYTFSPPLGNPTSPAPMPNPAPVRADAPTLGA